MKKARKKSKAETPREIKIADEKVLRVVEKGDEDVEDGRMDFGGIPNRDLKKNLGGCG